jgi:hypothetical protein
LLCEVARWQVPKKNSKKHLEMWSEIMDFQRTNRNKFYYGRSRFFILETKDSAVEAWMFIDEYEDQKAYDKEMKAVQSDVEIVKFKAKFYKGFESLRVPNSFKTEVWIEKPELAV